MPEKLHLLLEVPFSFFFPLGRWLFSSVQGSSITGTEHCPFGFTIFN
jgi:hypothetical protein